MDYLISKTGEQLPIEKVKVLIAVKTYPLPSKEYQETVCTAALFMSVWKACGLKGDIFVKIVVRRDGERKYHAGKYFVSGQPAIDLKEMKGNKMKKWKKEAIECTLILIFASFAWWWVCKEFQKPPLNTKSSVVKIYRGKWHKDYLEVIK